MITVFLIVSDVIIIILFTLLIVKRKQLGVGWKLLFGSILLFVIVHNLISHRNVGMYVIVNNYASWVEQSLGEYYDENHALPDSISELSFKDWLLDRKHLYPSFMFPKIDYYRISISEEKDVNKVIVYLFGSDFDDDEAKIVYDIGDPFYFSPLKNGDLIVAELYFDK